MSFVFQCLDNCVFLPLPPSPFPAIFDCLPLSVIGMSALHPYSTINTATPIATCSSRSFDFLFCRVVRLIRESLAQYFPMQFPAFVRGTLLFWTDSTSNPIPISSPMYVSPVFPFLSREWGRTRLWGC